MKKDEKSNVKKHQEKDLTEKMIIAVILSPLSLDNCVYTRKKKWSKLY